MTVLSVGGGNIADETPAPALTDPGRGPLGEGVNVQEPTAGPIGPDRREITVEPLPETAPVEVPSPQREPEPVR